MRVLFFGDTAGTGFGTVTRDLGRELLALGVDLRFMSLNEQPAELDEPFVGRTAVLGDENGWLAPEVLIPKIEATFTGGLFDDGWTPEAAIVLGDMGSLKVSPVLRILPDGFPAFHYVPIEGIGLPPSWRAVWDRLSPVAMCEFGADQIAKVTGSRPPVVYHGVDTEAFYPVSVAHPIVIRAGRELKVLRSKEACRKLLGWPLRERILFRADRHMPRKVYPALFRSMAHVLDKNRDVRLIWHCATIDQGGDLSDERSKYPPHIAGRMNSTGIHDHVGGAPRPLLAAMYNAADLYVSPSAEGFGLTIAEALACGTPAVGLDYSSVPEVIGECGVVVPGRLVDNIYSYFWATPDERALAVAVEGLLADPVRRNLMAVRAPIHVRSKFSWTKAAAQFRDLIEAAVPEAVAA